jgi:hypothetical protein
MFFYKNFQNKNLVFKTNEYQNLKSLHEKILLYNYYNEKNLIKPRKKREGFYFKENKKLINKIQTNFTYINYLYYIKHADYGDNFMKKNYKRDEKSILNKILEEISFYLNIQECNDSFRKYEDMIKNDLLSRKDYQTKQFIFRLRKEFEIDNKKNYFIYNIEDRALNAIFSNYISKLLKSYLILMFYLLLKVI